MALVEALQPSLQALDASFSEHLSAHPDISTAEWGLFFDRDGEAVRSFSEVRDELNFPLLDDGALNCLSRLGQAELQSLIREIQTTLKKQEFVLDNIEGRFFSDPHLLTPPHVDPDELYQVTYSTSPASGPLVLWEGAIQDQWKQVKEPTLIPELDLESSHWHAVPHGQLAHIQKGQPHYVHFMPGRRIRVAFDTVK